MLGFPSFYALQFFSIKQPTTEATQNNKYRPAKTGTTNKGKSNTTQKL
jgi:hypothetical protein